jgi:hypothetical protein
MDANAMPLTAPAVYGMRARCAARARCRSAPGQNTLCNPIGAIPIGAA